jgi:hypothetical protein
LSAVQVSEILAVVAIAVAVAAGAGLALVYRRLQRYQRNQHVIMGSRGTVDIVEHVSSVDDKLTNMRLALEDLTLAARDHDVRIDRALSRVGIVRFDAYQDLGGRQSTAVAFLNGLGDGVVITTVVSRDFARMYVKLLKEGVSDIPLAPEEVEALEQARGSGPFTVLPRVEGDMHGGVAADTETSVSPEDLPVELARENRRRRRQGMPLVEEAVVPSAVGWEEAHTPTPDRGSMAERFLHERRTARDRPGSGEEQSAPASEENGGGREL